jgi:hypothetical protein
MQSIRIDGLDIPFDPVWKNISISLSGGADSALLAYILCNVAKDHNVTVHVINHIRCWKTKPWQQFNADNVFQWLYQRFYRVNFKRHTNFIAPELEYGNTGPTLIDEYNKNVSGDNIQQRAFAEYICASYDVDAYYNAVTRNPKDIDLGGMSERDIDRDDNNLHLEIMQHIGRWALHPFRFVDKSWILRQYRSYEIMDLFDITRSCEGTFEEINFKNYSAGQFVPLCGKCFWCKEREWAIEQSK